MISLPELYKVDIERNQIIEKSILELNKQGIVFNEDDFNKKLDLPIMPGNLRKENINYDLLNQSFFKLNNEEEEEKTDISKHKRTRSLETFSGHNAHLYLEQQELKVLNKSLEGEEESARKKLFSLNDVDQADAEGNNQDYEI